MDVGEVATWTDELPEACEVCVGKRGLGELVHKYFEFN